MKKITIVLISFLAFSTGFAQTQKGFVRTIGRYYDDKHSNAIHRVAGANVVINDRTVVACDEDGDFKLEPGTETFVLKEVTKGGYKLISPVGLPKAYKCEKHKLEIIMAEENEEALFLNSTEQKINVLFNLRHHKSVAELNLMLKEGKITEDEWRRKYSRLFEQQDRDKQMIKELAEEYSRIDYAKIDKDRKKITNFIMQGKTVEARNLINRKDNIFERIDDLKQSKKVDEDDLFELFHDLGELARSFKVERYHDSVLFYLKKRCELDGLNTDFVYEVAKYYKDYAKNLDEALEWYDKCVELQKSVMSADHPALARSYNDIGSIYFEKGDYDEALKWYDKAFNIYDKVLDPQHIDFMSLHTDMGEAFFAKGNYDKALEWYNAVLSKEEKVLTANHP